MTVTDRVSFVVRVDPALGRINGRTKLATAGRGGRVFAKTSDPYREYKGAISLGAAAMRKRGYPRLDAGILACAITFYSKRQRHLENLPGGCALPLLDCDATIKATLDGLAKGGLIDDDARIVEQHVRKIHSDEPRVAIAVWRLL